jgi:hypothetical protein
MQGGAEIVKCIIRLLPRNPQSEICIRQSEGWPEGSRVGARASAVICPSINALQGTNHDRWPIPDHPFRLSAHRMPHPFAPMPVWHRDCICCEASDMRHLTIEPLSGTII